MYSDSRIEEILRKTAKAVIKEYWEIHDLPELVSSEDEDSDED